ncbi:hypothetical protein [Oceaniglobus roseus]|uniref:hypothetical protein n=1 Tax=Oceaniglobus roseus TaxID=1737570 RepID=UPI000C7EF697|nr:hypothetical protein [Kandeliimicrobium roseum]
MDFSFIVGLLALITLLAVCVLGIRGKYDVERLRKDPHAPRSNLAKDGPQGGVDLLQEERRTA